MTRPGDWHPIWSGDPTPGDPDGVSAAANTYGRTAANVGSAASTLLSITDGVGMRSDAIEAFQAKALHVRTDILKTQSRYAAASSVLAGYAGQLREAQADSLRILTAAQHTQNDHDLAQYRMHHARDEVAHATDPLAKVKAQTALNQQKVLADQANRDIGGYQSQLADVVARRQAAAKAAEQGLDDADTASAIRGDTFWDKLKHQADELVSTFDKVVVAMKEATDKVAHWIIDHEALITKILDYITTALTVLAVVSLFVFPAAAPVLFALSKITQTLSTAVSVLAVVSKTYLAATGQIPWRDVETAVVTLGVTYVAGKLIGKAGDAAAAGISKRTIKLVTARATTTLAARNAANGITRSARNQVDGGLGAAIRGIPTAIRRVKPAVVQRALMNSLEESKTGLELGYIVRKGPAHLGYTVGTRVIAGAGVVSEHAVSHLADEAAKKVTGFATPGIANFFGLGDHAQRRLVCPLPARVPAGAVA